MVAHVQIQYLWLTEKVHLKVNINNMLHSPPWFVQYRLKPRPIHTPFCPYSSFSHLVPSFLHPSLTETLVWGTHSEIRLIKCCINVNAGAYINRIMKMLFIGLYMASNLHHYIRIYHVTMHESQIYVQQIVETACRLCVFVNGTKCLQLHLYIGLHRDHKYIKFSRCKAGCNTTRHSVHWPTFVH